LYILYFSLRNKRRYSGLFTRDLIYNSDFENTKELDLIINNQMNYNGKEFRPISNTENGETSNETLFHYKQVGNILTSEYSGGKIKYGHLIGLVDHIGNINMRYHQVNDKNELMTGVCISKPEILENGKIRLHEQWEWTSGDKSKGTSILEEQ
jgi:hypothetical protein